MKMNKSMYKAFKDCHLKAYYEKSKISKTDENETYLVFYNYNKLKEIALKWISKKYVCVDVEKVSNGKYFTDKIQKTKELLREGKYNCIINACLDNGPIQGRIDFLIKAPDGLRYSPIIVKSAEDVKENVIDDACFVKTLLDDIVEIDKIYTISINKLYVKNGPLRARDLLSLDSKFDGKDLLELANENPLNVGQMEMFMLSSSKPKFVGSKNCKYCEWRTKCIKSGFLPEYSTLDLMYGRDTAFKHFKEGRQYIKDLPYDESFDKRQSAQIYCEKHPEKFIFEPKKIKRFLKDLKEPYHFLDFESLNTMIPRLDGTRPFEFVNFQYSLHQTMKDLKIYNHDAYLSFESDCRKEFLDKLLASLGDKGSIIVWNQEFEESRLNELAEQFPEYRERIDALHDRYFDLMIPFEKLWLYKQNMYGKYSLKYILPALTKEKSYSDLIVKNGLQTMILFFKILKGEEKAENHKQAMLDYCGLDTESMILILKEVLTLLKTSAVDSYISLETLEKEIYTERLNHRFKESKIPTLANYIISSLVKDIPSEDIDTEGYKIVQKWMSDNKDKDYISNDSLDEINIQDIINYWDLLPVEANLSSKLSKNKLLELIRVSRFALEHPDSNNILKLSAIIACSKDKKEKKISEETKDSENKETKQSVEKDIDIVNVEPKDDDYYSQFNLLEEEIDVNNPNIPLDEVQSIIDNIKIPSNEELKEYNGLTDILEEFKK